MKHFWRFLGGMLLVFLLIYAPLRLYGLLKYIITMTDQFWDHHIWQPTLQKNIPSAGFLLTLLLIYLAGTANETMWAAFFREKIIARIPFFGEFLAGLLESLKPQSRHIIQNVRGYVLAPLFGGYKPARIIGIFRIKRGYLVFLFYLAFPPLILIQPGKRKIYVFETIKRGDKWYDVLSTSATLRMELSGGASLSSDVLKNAVPITLREFIESRNLINTKE